VNVNCVTRVRFFLQDRMGYDPLLEPSFGVAILIAAPEIWSSYSGSPAKSRCRAKFARRSGSRYA
jgi:hypothetical protein